MPESPEQDRLSRKQFPGVWWKLNWQLKGAGRHPSLRHFTLLNGNRSKTQIETRQEVPARAWTQLCGSQGHPRPGQPQPSTMWEEGQTSWTSAPAQAPATSFGPDSPRTTGPHQARLPGESWSSLYVSLPLFPWGGPNGCGTWEREQRSLPGHSYIVFTRPRHSRDTLSFP